MVILALLFGIPGTASAGEPSEECVYFSEKHQPNAIACSETLHAYLGEDPTCSKNIWATNSGLATWPIERAALASLVAAEPNVLDEMFAVPGDPRFPISLQSIGSLLVDPEPLEAFIEDPASLLVIARNAMRDSMETTSSRGYIHCMKEYALPWVSPGTKDHAQWASVAILDTKWPEHLTCGHTPTREFSGPVNLCGDCKASGSVRCSTNEMASAPDTHGVHMARTIHGVNGAIRQSHYVFNENLCGLLSAIDSAMKYDKVISLSVNVNDPISGDVEAFFGELYRRLWEHGVLLVAAAPQETGPARRINAPWLYGNGASLIAPARYGVKSAEPASHFGVLDISIKKEQKKTPYWLSAAVPPKCDADDDASFTTATVAASVAILLAKAAKIAPSAKVAAEMVIQCLFCSADRTDPPLRTRSGAVADFDEALKCLDNQQARVCHPEVCGKTCCDWNRTIKVNGVFRHDRNCNGKADLCEEELGQTALSCRTESKSP